MKRKTQGQTNKYAYRITSADQGGNEPLNPPKLRKCSEIGCCTMSHNYRFCPKHNSRRTRHRNTEFMEMGVF